MLRRALQDIECGFYVDIGAYDSDINSVTRWFYDQGWSGVNVEPVATLLRSLQRDRPRDINLGVAIGAQNGSTTLHILAGTGCSASNLEMRQSTPALTSILML